MEQVTTLGMDITSVANHIQLRANFKKAIKSQTELNSHYLVSFGFMTQKDFWGKEKVHAENTEIVTLSSTCKNLSKIFLVDGGEYQRLTNQTKKSTKV